MQYLSKDLEPSFLKYLSHNDIINYYLSNGKSIPPQVVNILDQKLIIYSRKHLNFETSIQCSCGNHADYTNKLMKSARNTMKTKFILKCQCPSGKNVRCRVCMKSCKFCHKICCLKCLILCKNCGRESCKNCLRRCDLCQQFGEPSYCQDCCGPQCHCNVSVCPNCVEKCQSCGHKVICKNCRYYCDYCNTCNHYVCKDCGGGWYCKHCNSNICADCSDYHRKRRCEDEDDY